MTAMTTRIARHHLFAVLGLACAALALACLVAISLPPAFETTITKATPESGYAWVASLPKTFPGKLRPLYRISNGNIDGDRSTKLTENGRPLGPGGTLHDDIRQMGQGRYSHWGNSLYFAASDNSNPNTNGRKYILRTTTSARGYLYGITSITAGLGLLFFCLCKGKLAFTELWLIGKALPAELWSSAKKRRLALQEKQNRFWRAYTKRFFLSPCFLSHVSPWPTFCPSLFPWVLGMPCRPPACRAFSLGLKATCMRFFFAIFSWAGL